MNNYIFNIDDLSEKEFEYYFSLMSQSRKASVERKKRQDDKRRSVTGEMLVKKHFGDDTIIDGEIGKKPYLVNKKGEFSISHSGSLVAVSVSDAPVGIDIEKIRDVKLNVAKKLCNEKELIYVFGKIPKDEDFDKKDKAVLIRFFEIWTFKEAYFKFVGTGITNFLSVDYFDENIRRIKELKDDYMLHIIY